MASSTTYPKPAPTFCIVLSEHLTNPYTGPLASGAIAAAAMLGCRLILYSPLNIPMDRHDMGLAEFPLLPRRVDAYLMPEFIAPELIDYCRENGATVLTYAGTRAGLPSIGPDNYAGAFNVVTHLITHGRRRIAHLMGPPKSDEAVVRYNGYCAALDAAGIALDPALVIVGNFRAIDAQDALAALIESKVQFDAIFAANDLSARGALLALKLANLRVPEDIALVGFDDSHNVGTLIPPLTTVRQSAFQIGWDAIHTLCSGAELPPLTTVKTSLVIRESCGCRPRPPAGTADWAAHLAARFGAGSGPIVESEQVAALLGPLDTPDDQPGEWLYQLENVWMQALKRGWNERALRDYLPIWSQHRIAQGAIPAQIESQVVLAKERLSLLQEARSEREQIERGFRLNAIMYVIDMLRAYSHDQVLGPMLRYMVDSGPRTALSAQPAPGETIIVQYFGSDSLLHQWHGNLKAFPPSEWLDPGETMLLMPMSGGQQRSLIGVSERTGRVHIDLDDLLLRSINTYRSLTALNETLRELELARSVQLSLLPRQTPALPGYDIAGASRTARQVGGDLYGYYARSDGTLALAVGDVAGKGMPAALLMSACVTTLAGVIQVGLPPGQTLSRAHQVLQPHIGRTQNAAICLAYLNGPQVRFANAGAVAPLIRDTHGVHMLEIGGLPLGTPLSGIHEYDEAGVELAPGDMVVLSSDGIVEAMNGNSEIYGFERFMAALAAGPIESAQHMLTHLFADVLAFGGETEMHDDMAIVVVLRR